MGGQSLCSFQTSRCSRQAQWNTAVPRLSRCFCIRSSGRVGLTDAPAHVCLWMDQRPTCDRTAGLARPPQTCTFWSQVWAVQILVLAPKISQIPMSPLLQNPDIYTGARGKSRPPMWERRAPVEFPSRGSRISLAHRPFCH